MIRNRFPSYIDQTMGAACPLDVDAKGGGKNTPAPPPPMPPAPPPPPPEKPQSAKPVTESATSARQSQKDKANKAAGIQGSVFTSPLTGQDGQTEGKAGGKTLLGQ